VVASEEHAKQALTLANAIKVLMALNAEVLIQAFAQNVQMVKDGHFIGMAQPRH